MSQKIDDVLDVLDRIRRGYRAGQPHSVREVRIQAIHDIAEQRGVTHQTIGDAYLRRLKPDVDGTLQFDRVVGEWLGSKSNTLRHILDKHALDRGDSLAIQRFFQ